MDMRTAQALIRFGLGRRGSEAPPPDPAAWLARQLDGPDPALAVPGASSGDGLVALREDRAEEKVLRKDRAEQTVLRKDRAEQTVLREDRAEQKVLRGDRGERRAGAPSPAVTPPAVPPPTRVHDLVQREQQAAIDGMLTTAAPFRERLVWFWANHFTVSFRRDDVRPVVFAYVREAIRPHVTGRFADMLLAVMRHPAMLAYLDNTSSVGPDSPVGQRSRRGLNENLARECLELHTVTPASGYTQADVTEFARVLTGWTYEMAWNPPQFHFRLSSHQPGAKTVLGRRFDHGLGGGLEALAFLADHPATHRNLATRLVRHFVADVPPPEAVRHVEGVLRDTQGDLRAAALEVTRLPQAWTPLTKLRPPAEHVVAVMRALDLPAAERPDLHPVMAGLGEPLLAPPLPNGWSDTAADWSGGEGLLRRVDWLWGLAGRVQADPVDVADAALGPLLSAGSAARIGRAGSRREGLTLLFASPEFMRR